MSQKPVSAGARLRAQGRLVLPAAVREAAKLEEGATLIVHAEGVGRVVMETPDAARERVRAAAPARSERDTRADVRAARDQDSQTSDAAIERRRAAGRQKDPSDAKAAGDDLLRHLGLA